MEYDFEPKFTFLKPTLSKQKIVKTNDTTKLFCYTRTVRF